MLAKFLEFETKNEQDTFLQSCIKLKDIARRRNNRKNEQNVKTVSCKFKVTSSVNEFRVCRQGLVKLFGVSVERIKRLINLQKKGEAPIDKRGKHAAANAISNEIIQTIISHISSFPADDAHYKSTGYLYLNQRLNVALMYQLFKKKHPNVFASYYTYLKIFSTRFKLRFGRPKVDTCSTCEELNVKIKSKFLNETAKRSAVAEKMVHLRRANKFYVQLKTLRQDTSEDTAVISFDFMQNLALPHLPVQDTFYLRQLTISVFSIHNVKTGKSKYYVYHEGICGKGANEVGSFLLQYISQLPDNIQHLHVFSDNCYGQNRNHTIVRMFLALAHNRFASVTQYFPIRGHSYMPNDRDFGHLKARLRVEDRIFTTMKFVRLIASAPNVEEVQLVQPSDILDITHWWPTVFKKSCVALETQRREVPRDQKVTFQITNYMQFSYFKDGVIFAQRFINGLQGYHFELLHRAAPDQISFSPPKITQTKPLKKEKMKDLHKFKRFLPQTRYVQKFWSNIFKWKTC